MCMYLQILSFSLTNRTPVSAFLPHPREKLHSLRQKSIDSETFKAQRRGDSAADAEVLLKYHAYAILLQLIIEETEKLGGDLAALYGRDDLTLAWDESAAGSTEDLMRN